MPKCNSCGHMHYAYEPHVPGVVRVQPDVWTDPAFNIDSKHTFR